MNRASRREILYHEKVNCFLPLNIYVQLHIAKNPWSRHTFTVSLYK